MKYTIFKYNNTYAQSLMINRHKSFDWMLLSLLFFVFISVQATDFIPQVTDQRLDNPHRGFALWGSNVVVDGGLPPNHYESSLYHVYIPWRMIESADQVFEWDLIENTYLQPILQLHPEATFVIRVIADYPGGAPGNTTHYNGMDVNRDYPLFLEQAPFNITRNDYSGCSLFGTGLAPDWNDPNFAAQVTELLSALANYFDGDHRITTVQTGLLGFWGEWHQFGCEQFAPQEAIKNHVKQAYNNAFSQTTIQTRYANDPDATEVEFGFYEDYFPSFTANCLYDFPLCSDSGPWNLEYGFTHVVPDARNNWMSNPVSGESPEIAQKEAWVNDTTDIVTVLSDYHFSFLGPAGKHGDAGHDTALDAIANHLGYRFVINTLSIDEPIINGRSQIAVEIENIGTSPLYFDYHIVIDVTDLNGINMGSQTISHNLKGLLPNQPLILNQWSHNLPTSLNGVFQLTASIKPINGLGRTIIPANIPIDANGHLTLGEVSTTFDPDLIFFNGFD